MPKKLREKSKGKLLNNDVFLKHDESIPNLTKNFEQFVVGKTWKKADHSRIEKKGNFDTVRMFAI